MTLSRINEKNPENQSRNDSDREISQELLKKCFDSLPDIIGIKTPDHSVIMYNSKGYEFLGLTPDQAIGKKCYQLLDREIPCANCPTKTALETGQSIQRQVYFKEIDTWFDCHSKAIFDEQGRPVYVVERLKNISRQKKAEQDLIRTNRKISSILNSINEGFFAIDNDTSITFFNAAAEKILNRKASQVVGKRLLEAFPQIEGSELVQRIFKVLHTGQSDRFEIYLDLDPYENWYDINIQPYENGTSIYFQVTTERKRHEQALKLNAWRMNMLNRCLLDLGSDYHENVNKLTRLAGELFNADCAVYNRLRGGLLVSEGTWNTPEDYTSVDNPTGHICSDVIIRGGKKACVIKNLDETSYADTDRNVQKYGLKTYVGHPVKCSGNPLGSICVVFTREITPTQDDLHILGLIASALSSEEHRRQTEEALRQSEEKYRGLVESAEDIIFSLDDRGVFTYTSPTIEQLLGFKPSELVGYSFEEVVHPEDVQTGYTALENLFATGEPQGGIEYRVRRKDGEWRWHLTNASPQFNAQGKIFSCIGIARDITESKIARDELAEAKKKAEMANLTKSEFLANMSHEIRTPMNGIMGMLHLLKETSLDEQQSEYIEMSISSAERLTELLSDILDLSKVEAGKMEISQAPFSLQELAKTAVDMFRIMAGRKNLTLNYHVEPSIPDLLVGDEARIRQIIFNLVGNAVKFTDSGRVSLEIYKLKQESPQSIRVLFTVSDTGIGMNDESISRLFNPFVQAYAGSRRKYQGAGLGLSIVKKLVELMQGTISIESEPGRGSVFYVSLPLGTTSEQKEPRQKRPEIQEDRIPENLNILVAEDDPTNQLVLNRILKKLGHKVTVVDNGEQALDEIRRQRFDFVFMDIHMPVMDGVETTQKIRKLEQEEGCGPDQQKDDRDGPGRVPIIALTADAMAGSRETYLKQGMDDYLSKPVDWKDLKEVMNRNMN